MDFVLSPDLPHSIRQIELMVEREKNMSLESVAELSRDTCHLC